MSIAVRVRDASSCELVYELTAWVDVEDEEVSGITGLRVDDAGDQELFWTILRDPAVCASAARGLGHLPYLAQCG